MTVNVAQQAQGEIVVSIVGGQFRVTDYTNGGAVESFPLAWQAIRRANELAQSGERISVSPGTYVIGQSTSATAASPTWVSMHPNVSIISGLAGPPSAPNNASRLDVGSWGTPPANFTPLAYCNFATPFSLANTRSVIFWLRPSFSAPSGSARFRGPFTYRLMSGLNGTGSVIADYQMWEPEGIVANAWEMYRMPGANPGGGVAGIPGVALPTSPATTIQSIVLAHYNQNVPSGSYNLTIGAPVYRVERNSIISNFKSGTEFFGDRIDTIFLAHPNMGDPILDIGSASNLHVHDLHLNGNVANNHMTDMCVGIYSPAASATGRKIHHCWIHDTQGSGMQIRGSGIEVYENFTEDCVNAGIQLSATSNNPWVHHNTTLRGGNDGALWAFGSNGLICEYNYMEGPGGGIIPFNVLDYATNWTLRFNRIVCNGSNYGIQMSETDRGVVENNEVTGYTSRGIVTWGSTTVTNMIFRHNYCHSPASGAADGIEINCNDAVVEFNETAGHTTGLGADINGTGNTGGGNWFPDGLSNASGNSVAQGSGPPARQSFTAGASWNPHA